MSAHTIRLGGHMSTMGPDPKLGGGCYLFVLNGALEMQDKSLPRWSMVFIEPSEEAVEIRAGLKGLEALVMQFPKDDDSQSQPDCLSAREPPATEQGLCA